MIRGTNTPANTTNGTNISNGRRARVLAAPVSLRKPLRANQHGVLVNVGLCWLCWSVLAHVGVLVSVGLVGGRS